MTRRRVVVAVIAGALALGGLVACDSHPAVAAYVGETEYTVDEVEEIFEDLIGRQPETTVTRQQILETLVVGQLVRSLATEQGGDLREVSAADVAVGENVPAESRYAEIRADLATHMFSWSGQVEVTTPTEEQLREVHQATIDAGEEWADQPFEELGPILGNEQVAQAIAIREAFAAEAERVGVTVNPRFAPLQYVFLRFSGGAPAIYITLGDSSDTVDSDG